MRTFPDGIIRRTRSVRKNARNTMGTKRPIYERNLVIFGPIHIDHFVVSLLKYVSSSDYQSIRNKLKNDFNERSFSFFTSVKYRFDQLSFVLD